MCLGIPGEIVEIREGGDLLMGVVDFGGVTREVCLAFVADEARVGDYAVVHVGFAIALVDEAEALRTFRLLQEMGEVDELTRAQPGGEEGAAAPPLGPDRPRTEDP